MLSLTMVGFKPVMVKRIRSLLRTFAPRLQVDLDTVSGRSTEMSVVISGDSPGEVAVANPFLEHLANYFAVSPEFKGCAITYFNGCKLSRNPRGVIPVDSQELTLVSL